MYRIHGTGLWQSSSENKRLLEGMISNLRYLDIFPEAAQKWKKDFISQYRAFLGHLLQGESLSEKEYNLFHYVLDLLKDKKIALPNTNSSNNQLKKPKKIKYKILLKIYKYCRKKLRKKGYSND